METADPLNPSSKAEAAEDLIEELAKLMADDAQINAPTPASGSAASPKSPLTSPQNTAHSFTSVPSDNSSKSGDQKSQGLASSSPASSGPASSGQGLQGNNTNPDSASQPIIGKFDLGKPAANVSSVSKLGTGSTGKVENASAGASEPAQIPPASLRGTTPDSTQPKQVPTPGADQQNIAAPDFDFGFGVGPDGPPTGETAPINMPVNSTRADPHSAKPDTPQVPVSDSAPLDAKPDTPVGQDPIAALINAAVAGQSSVDKNAEMSAAELVSADMPLNKDAPNSPDVNLKKSDGFTTPPVFGLEGAPTPQRETVAKTEPVQSPIENPIGGSSALDDIEALIGNSVDISSQSRGLEDDISAQQAVEGPSLTSVPPVMEHPAPSSIAPMSGTPDAPVVNDGNPEASILDAMAGAGAASSAGTPKAQTESLHAPEQSEPLLAPGRVKTQSAEKQGRSKILLPIVGVLLLGMAGVAGYLYFNQPQTNAEAPVLIADPTPSRAEPAPVEEVARSVVLNEIDNAGSAPQNEQLVSRDETEGATGAQVRRVITADNSEAGLANRRVRTVTVRPDGTIVSGDDTAAGSQVLPVEQPNLPDLPANAVNTELSQTTVAALPNSANELAVQNPNLVTVNGDSVPFPRPPLTNRAILRSAAIASETQLPQTTGVSTNGQTSVVNLINQATDTVSPATNVNVTPVATTTSATPATTNNVSNPQAYVQLASQRSQSVANQTASTMQSRYSSALRGGRLLVRRVDLGTRGIYYRVQLPTATLSDANSICNSIKSAGGDCFTRNN